MLPPSGETQSGKARRSPATEIRSDETYFSPRSSFVADFPAPECRYCQKSSVGARFLEFVPGGGLGTHCWVAEFLCDEHRNGQYLPLTCANLSQWKILSRTAPGIYGVRKLSQEEQNLRASKMRESAQPRFGRR